MRPGQAGWMADSGLRYGRDWGAGVAGPGGVYRGTHRTYAKNLNSIPRIAHDPTETLPRR